MIRFIPTPFPVAARRTGRADFPHPALSRIMPSPTEGRALARTGARGATTCWALVGMAVNPLAAHRVLPAQPLAGPITAPSAVRSSATASLPIHPRLPPSLSHVVPCEAPRLFGVARRKASIACRSLLPAPFPDQGSFPPPALPGFTGTTTLSATPRGRFRASRHHRWPAPPASHPKGLPVLHTTPLSHMPSPLPRRNRWVLSSFASPTAAAFPEIQAGRLPHCPFRGLLSVHCTLRPMRSPSPLRTLYTRSFDRFVSSTAVPIATGWNDICRVGFAPTEVVHLCTAH